MILWLSVDAAKKLYNEILASQNKEHQKEAFAGLGIINYITVSPLKKIIINRANNNPRRMIFRKRLSIFQTL
jgi:hypothetical protein